MIKSRQDNPLAEKTTGIRGRSLRMSAAAAMAAFPFCLGQTIPLSMMNARILAVPGVQMSHVVR
jgi:hypothetical protein